MRNFLKGAGSVLAIGRSIDYDVLVPLRTTNQRAVHCLGRMAERLRDAAKKLEESEETPTRNRISGTRRKGHSKS